jgi:hypothetical protein
MDIKSFYWLEKVTDSLPFLIWQTLPSGSSEDYRCIDLSFQNTNNGNGVWYYPCNFTPGKILHWLFSLSVIVTNQFLFLSSLELSLIAQWWFYDYDTRYIRSSVDRNKCLVGDGWSNEQNTKLMINDCYNDDDRFRWVKYIDNSIRPWNNIGLCIQHGSEAETDLILDYCLDGYKEFYWLENESPGKRKRTTEAEMNGTEMLQGTVMYGKQEGCTDYPIGWYDIFGRNCEWYGEGDNCDTYGDQYAKFGKTANSAVSFLTLLNCRDLFFVGITPCFL